MTPAPLSKHVRAILDKGGAGLLAKVAHDIHVEALEDLEIYLANTPATLWKKPEHRETFDDLLTEAYQAFYDDKDMTASAKKIQLLAAHAKACGPETPATH